MRRMTAYLRRLACLLALLLPAASCVHEFPQVDYGPVPFVLDLDFDTALPLFQEILYTRSGEETRSTAPHDVRYVVKVFNAGETRAATRAERGSYIFTAPVTDRLDRSVTIDLEEGDWDIYVWTDYVDPDSGNDKYYDTADFGAIIYREHGQYEGGNEYREAFRGSVSVSVIHPDRFLESEAQPSYHATVDMVRPMGRFEFISNDVEKFMERLEMMNPTRSGAPLTRADLDGFHVVFRYNAFMPCQFNMFSDKPSDSWTGMSFETRMDLSDEGILMGFDYVLVNGAETVMNISLEVYDGDGVMISSCRPVEVPIVRSRLTVVKGEFLTAFGAGGVAINPGFDGPDFNMEIK